VRIVGGRFRGRPLVAPTHEGTRPTSDRVREAIFNILAHGAAEVELEGARVLDLFAGTGALGLEALSRGALFCLFVEHDAQARGLTRRNIEALGLTGVTKLFRRDATELGPAGNNSGFTLAFLDPPYGQGLAVRSLASAAEGGWLAPGAVAVVEEHKGTELALPGSYTAFDQRTWGDTQVLFARFMPDRG
jgi:16S rRNA (guanine966-N2)-methyltransferase